ncbi:hypothetical protein D3C84_712310 [compost metagenome]
MVGVCVVVFVKIVAAVIERRRIRNSIPYVGIVDSNKIRYKSLAGSRPAVAFDAALQVSQVIINVAGVRFGFHPCMDLVHDK